MLRVSVDEIAPAVVVIVVVVVVTVVVAAPEQMHVMFIVFIPCVKKS